MDHELVKRILRITAEHDQRDELWWTEDARFLVNCNDVFAWACADAEEITPDNIEVFEQAIVDSENDGPILFCCRVRGMRPQGAMYPHLDKKDWPLFDACGPVRCVEFGNPVDRQG